MIFHLSQIELVNALVIAMGLGICLLCFIQITASKHLQKSVRRYFQVFFVVLALYISAHLARQLMNGITVKGIYTALHVVTFLEVSAAGFLAFLISMLILAVATQEKGIKWLGIAFLTLFIAHEIILAIGVPFKLVYFFDENNTYSRGAGYLLSNLVPVLMIIIDMAMLCVFRRNIKGKVRSSFWVYMIAPIVAIIIQGIVQGLQLIIFAMAGAAVYMFSVIIGELNEIYAKQSAEKTLMESELSLANRIQADMLPNTYPAFPDRAEFDIYASMEPARNVGGDFYDFFLVDEDHLCMMIADVSGKGIPAALFMMASRIILASNAKLGRSPAEILKSVNDAICQNNREEMFVTVWLGILEISTGKLTAANAGHEYPILMNGGNFEIVKDKHGLVIGGMSGAKYTEYEIRLMRGAKLFVYTDGVPEATNINNELFGMERTVAALNADKTVAPEQILKNVRAAVSEFVKDAEQFDDLTMLCMEYKGKGELK